MINASRERASQKGLLHAVTQPMSRLDHNLIRVLKSVERHFYLCVKGGFAIANTLRRSRCDALRKLRVSATLFCRHMTIDKTKPLSRIIKLAG